MNWFDMVWNELGRRSWTRALTIILAVVAILSIAIILIAPCKAQAQAQSAYYHWIPPTHWNSVNTCPQGPDGEPITDPVSYHFRWGINAGGPYPNLIVTNETFASVPNPFGPNGGIVYGVLYSVVLGRESCGTEERAVPFDPFLPNPPTNLQGVVVP